MAFPYNSGYGCIDKTKSGSTQRSRNHFFEFQKDQCIPRPLPPIAIDSARKVHAYEHEGEMDRKRTTWSFTTYQVTTLLLEKFRTKTKALIIPRDNTLTIAIQDESTQYSNFSNIRSKNLSSVSYTGNIFYRNDSEQNCRFFFSKKIMAWKQVEHDLKYCNVILGTIDPVMRGRDYGSSTFFSKSPSKHWLTAPVPYETQSMAIQTFSSQYTNARKQCMQNYKKPSCLFPNTSIKCASLEKQRFYSRSFAQILLVRFQNVPQRRKTRDNYWEYINELRDYINETISTTSNAGTEILFLIDGFPLHAVIEEDTVRRPTELLEKMSQLKRLRSTGETSSSEGNPSHSRESLLSIENAYCLFQYGSDVIKVTAGSRISSSNVFRDRIEDGYDKCFPFFLVLLPKSGNGPMIAGKWAPDQRGSDIRFLNKFNSKWFREISLRVVPEQAIDFPVFICNAPNKTECSISCAIESADYSRLTVDNSISCALLKKFNYGTEMKLNEGFHAASKFLDDTLRKLFGFGEMDCFDVPRNISYQVQSGICILESSQLLVFDDVEGFALVSNDYLHLSLYAGLRQLEPSNNDVFTKNQEALAMKKVSYLDPEKGNDNDAVNMTQRNCQDAQKSKRKYYANQFISAPRQKGQCPLATEQVKENRLINYISYAKSSYRASKRRELCLLESFLHEIYIILDEKSKFKSVSFHGISGKQCFEQMCTGRLISESKAQENYSDILYENFDPTTSSFEQKVPLYNETIRCECKYNILDCNLSGSRWSTDEKLISYCEGDFPKCSKPFVPDRLTEIATVDIDIVRFSNNNTSLGTAKNRSCKQKMLSIFSSASGGKVELKLNTEDYCYRLSSMLSIRSQNELILLQELVTGYDLVSKTGPRNEQMITLIALNIIFDSNRSESSMTKDKYSERFVTLPSSREASELIFLSDSPSAGAYIIHEKRTGGMRYHLLLRGCFPPLLGLTAVTRSGWQEFLKAIFFRNLIASSTTEMKSLIPQGNTFLEKDNGIKILKVVLLRSYLGVRTHTTIIDQYCMHSPAQYRKCISAITSTRTILNLPTQVPDFSEFRLEKLLEFQKIHNDFSHQFISITNRIESNLKFLMMSVPDFLDEDNELHQIVGNQMVRNKFPSKISSTSLVMCSSGAVTVNKILRVYFSILREDYNIAFSGAGRRHESFDQLHGFMSLVAGVLKRRYLDDFRVIDINVQNIEITASTAVISSCKLAPGAEPSRISTEIVKLGKPLCFNVFSGGSLSNHVLNSHPLLRRWITLNTGDPLNDLGSEEVKKSADGKPSTAACPLQSETGGASSTDCERCEHDETENDEHTSSTHNFLQPKLEDCEKLDVVRTSILSNDVESDRRSESSSVSLDICEESPSGSPKSRKSHSKADDPPGNGNGCLPSECLDSRQELRLESIALTSVVTGESVLYSGVQCLPDTECSCVSYATRLCDQIMSDARVQIKSPGLIAAERNSAYSQCRQLQNWVMDENESFMPLNEVDHSGYSTEDNDVVKSDNIVDRDEHDDCPTDKSKCYAQSKSTTGELKQENCPDILRDIVQGLLNDVLENLCSSCGINDTSEGTGDTTRLEDEVKTFTTESASNVLGEEEKDIGNCTEGDINFPQSMKNDAVTGAEINVLYDSVVLTENSGTGCSTLGESAPSFLDGESLVTPRDDVAVSTENPVSGEDFPKSSTSSNTLQVELDISASLIGEGETETNSSPGQVDRRRFSCRKLKRDSYRSSLIFKKSSELSNLVEEHLKDVFVPFESVRTQLVRQSRDILLCRYQGDFVLFRENFLTPASRLLTSLREKYPKVVCVCGKFNYCKPSEFSVHRCQSYCDACAGWPLCFNRRLIVHLGDLDEGLVKPGDCYICVREVANSVESSCPIYLSIKYRTKSGLEELDCAVREHRIHEKDFGDLFSAMDWLASADSQVMISDDQLTTVLQHLLLSVERGIERLEWDGVSKYWPGFSGQTGVASRCCHAVGTNTKDCSVQTSPEHEVSELSSSHRLSVGSQDSDVTNMKGIREDGFCLSKDGSKEQNSSSAVEDTVLRLSMVNQGDDEPDDGYYEHTLTHPTAVGQVDQDLLHSEVAVLPGSRDSSGRSIVILSSPAMREFGSVSACHLAQLLLYFRTIPKKEVVSRGFFVLIDGSNPWEEFWSVLDETFCLLEANVSNAISQTVLLSEAECVDPAMLFPTSRIQCEVVSTKDKLQKFAPKEQLLQCHGGNYTYDHQEWISFRKFLEPFINGCRLSGRHLVSLLEELRGSRLPPSSALTHQMIEQQKNVVRVIFQDEQLRHLEEEGDTILKELDSYRTRSPHNADYSENLERTSVLYDELRKALSKLARLADRRLRRLEECLQMRTFQEESSQVLSWLCRKGSDALEKHQAVADSLVGIKEQEEEFEKFYFLAMRQIERGNDLLEEVSVLSQESSSLPKIREETQAAEEDGGVQELAASLRQHLGSFSEKLEGTRERIEDTAKCYQLVDKSYEWALEAMRFVSQMGLANTGSIEGVIHQIRCLQDYLDDHLPISEETFQEIVDIANRLSSDKLLEQCKVVKLRCQETVDLIQARLATLLKVKQQMEVESFRGPIWDCEDTAPTPRTSRSHSQPSNMWAPAVSSTPYPSCLGHHRRCSDSTAIPSVPQSYGSPMGSYTSFPSSYYPTAKDSYHLDSYIQEKEEQLLQRGLITEDLTSQGPVTSISRGFLDSRIGNRDSSTSASSSSSSSSSCSSGKGIVTSVLRSSGRGSYNVNNAGGVSLRWSKKASKRCQSWQLRDETLEKIKNEVKEQNDLLRVERLRSPSQESNLDGTCSSTETDLSPSSESCCKVPVSHAQPDPVRGPVPVNTHLLNPASSDSTDNGTATDPTANTAEAKAKKTLMLIMNEMIQTERDYVKSLEYIIEYYIPELLREDIPQALRGQRNVVFGNIEKIFEFHSQFFLNELEQCESTPFSVGQCFLKYEPQFYLYALYNKNKPKSDALIIEYGSTFFRKKQLELEDKMDLASYLLKPVQRMGKYALLLKQLLKECPEREIAHQDLKAAEEMVRFQLRHGNDLLAMDALRDCDVNVKEQGRLLRQDEFLVWQGRSRKSLRHVFLFEDLILFSKARRDPQRKGYEMYQYKHSIKTTDMGLTEQVGDSPTKFEIWFRKRKLNDTYVLQALSPDIKSAWVHELSKLLWKQALRNREMRLAEMSSMGIGNKPCLDIKPSEDQINDRSITLHQLVRAPRFRNSMGMGPYDVKSNKRPHSIISVSSSSSSGSSQSSFTFYGTLNLGFEPGDSPRPLHRSLTQQSQCSTESGFYTDSSAAGDSPTDSERSCHKKAERSDSLLSSDSLCTSASPSELNCSPSEDQVVEESITTSM